MSLRGGVVGLMGWVDGWMAYMANGNEYKTVRDEQSRRQCYFDRETVHSRRESFYSHIIFNDSFFI